MTLSGESFSLGARGREEDDRDERAEEDLAQQSLGQDLLEAVLRDQFRDLRVPDVRLRVFL